MAWWTSILPRSFRKERMSSSLGGKREKNWRGFRRQGDFISLAWIPMSARTVYWNTHWRRREGQDTKSGTPY